MLQLNPNGVVIQEMPTQSDYKGIEGKNWYFNVRDTKTNFEIYFDDEIEKSWIDDRYVDCCSNIGHINDYIMESKRQNIKIRLLFCETPKAFPIMAINSQWNLRFVGYDYAYAGGSYYSCINNDVVPNRIPEMKGLKLNENGLFNTEEEIQEFIKMREQLKAGYSPEAFEEGDFIVYKLSEIINLEEKD